MHHDVCTEIFLPEHILFQDALWKYDKSGYIQEILVQLKYHGMGKLGGQLGSLLGFHLLSNPAFRQSKDYILIPVPLHTSRKRKRGYNQALLIAEGISSVTNIPVLEERCITRIRNTQSQTGFNLDKRMQNIKDAFKVNKPEALSGRIPILVDDVFTTGTTTFELSAAIMPYSKHEMGIVTVAMA
ncbi:MAG: ComF family protein [Balneolales bacterium]